MNTLRRQVNLLAVALGLIAWLVAWPAAAPLLDYTVDVGGSMDAPFVSGTGLAAIVDGVTYRWSEGDARLRLPTFDTAASVQIAVRTGRHWQPTNQPLTLTLRVNGYVAAAWSLQAGWDWYTATISPVLLGAGLNLNLASPTFTDANGINQLGVPLDAVMLHSLDMTPTPDYWLPLLLALAVMLATLFGGLGNRRVVGLGAGLAVLAIGAPTLYLYRPLFALYIGWVVVGLAVLLLTHRLVRYLPVRRDDAAVGAYLFALTIAVYLLCASGQFTADDDAVKYLASGNLLTQQSLALPTPIYGATYSKYGIGPTLVNVPLLTPVLLLEAVSKQPLPQLRQLSVTMFNPLLGALLVLLLYRTALLLYHRRDVAATLALIGGFATTIFAYALLTSTELLLALVLLAIAYCLLRWQADDANSSWLARVGLLLAAAMLLKQEYVLIALVVIGWCALRTSIHDSSTSLKAKIKNLISSWRTGGLPRPPTLHRVLWLAGPIMLAVIANMAYNLLANGNALNPGYTASAFVAPSLSAEITGIYGMLASPGKSLFLYSPPLLLLPFAARRFAATHKWEVGLWATVAAAMLVFYARLTFWSGDLAWGPRYIMPLTPLLVLPLGVLLANISRWSPRRRCGFALLITGGGVVQLLSATVSFQQAFFSTLPMGGDVAAHYAATQFMPAQSPLVRMAEMLTQGQIAAPASLQLSGYGLPLATDYLIPLLLILIATTAASRLWYALCPMPSAAPLPTPHTVAQPVLGRARVPLSRNTYK